MFKMKQFKFYFLLALLVLVFMPVEVMAQQGIPVRGTISDIMKEAMPGVTVVVRGTTTGASSDVKGEFSITVPSDTCFLQFSFIGYETVYVPVGNRRIFAVTMKETEASLEEVTIVAFGTQKKESVVSAIQTVNVKDLIVPSSNLTTAFAGRIAGMISYQTSGEPGHDDADFFIRGVTSFGTGKVDPLILVDNVEVTKSDLANLHPDDIQSFSILKDATAAALYGARGANGVILISTKEGREGPARLNLRFETAISQPTRLIEMADPITYMYAANEAYATRYPDQPTPYNDYKIFHTIQKTNPWVYPNVDWMDMLIKPRAFNQRANMSISGGGNIARYYVAGSYTHDNGILKVDKRNSFNNNINSNKYLLHTNVNINLTKSTELIVRLHGTFNDYQGPITGGSDLFEQILLVSPVDFPAYYKPVGNYTKVDDILFGGEQINENTYMLNPYAEMLKGYQQKSNSTMMAQFELKQKLEKWVEGLSSRILLNTQRYGAFNQRMQYQPLFFQVASYDRINDEYTLTTNYPNAKTHLNQNASGKKLNYSLYAEGSLNYNRTFAKKHDVNAMVVGVMRHYLSGDADNLPDALPQRNLGVSGRLMYGYDSRYSFEFNFGYNGSEKFDKGHRWGFFPSVGAAWNITKESFFPEKLKDYVSKFRIRGTYGLVGNDAIGNQRFFYISEVVPEGGGAFKPGVDFTGLERKGYNIKNYPNPNITWEVAYKTNIGIELALFDNKLEIQPDIFWEHRTKILQERANVPIEMGLWSTPLVNIGEASGRGMDMSVDYKHNVSADLWFVARGNFTYARSTYLFYEEPKWDMVNCPWKSKKDRPVKQKWGLIGERLFIDNTDVETSARQEFGRCDPGDIKYKDMNDDGVINELDEVPIGYPTTPEINYGFGLSLGYKGFDFSFFFSGSARSSFFMNPSKMEPFLYRTVKTPGHDGKDHTARMTGGLTKFIADDHWTEQSQNPNAFWPRLSPVTWNNNTQTSTWWMFNGRYLRLKSFEMGYTLPQQLTTKVRMKSARIYLNGTNLLLFSKFKLWDIEMGSNGLNYPLQRVFNVGVNVSF